MYGLETTDQFESQKTSISRAFNRHFFEFLDDVISIYPENEVLRGARNSFEMFKKANPTSIIKVWYKYIYSPYKDEIEAGNLDYFLDKDYSVDLQKGTVNNMQKILDKIDSIRDPIREMGDTNRTHSLKYITNLSKLSLAYAPFI
jgi:hypothetical protein